MTTGLVQRLREAGCVFAEDEARLLVEAARDDAHLESLVARRVAGEPLEPLLGWVEFCGLRLAIDPGVFVPRRRTEFLVASAARVTRPGAVLVDLCCGSGAVGAALLADDETLDLYACDIEAAAVTCAGRNLGPDRVYPGDLFTALPDTLHGRVDVLVANAPYVPTAEIPMMPTEARDYESAVALDGGADGVDVHRRIAVDAPRWLVPGGRLLIETSGRQAPTTAASMQRAGLTTQIEHDDELDATVVIGTV
ncbi:MAG: putative protein N(5)-glutamine methyltransferase [Actinomycetota bacterium]|nr:putative protein N(5)-glutamine methyltransferase [Actinomycetota bacterium]